MSGVSWLSYSEMLLLLTMTASIKANLKESIFIPSSCREIAREAFRACTKLIMLHVPRHTRLGEGVIGGTLLIKASAFEIDEWGYYHPGISENVNEWIKNINGDDDQFALHRACSSFNPIADVLYQIVRRQGLVSFRKKNEIETTPLEYLEANPFAEHIDQRSILKRYVLEMMGEAV